MGITVLFHTNDQWDYHRILYSGRVYGAELTLFADAYSHYISGQHVTPVYDEQIHTVTRLVMASGIYPIAGFSGGAGIPYSVDGPDSSIQNAKIAHYLNEWNEALGTAYIEMASTSGINKGHISYYEGYPISDFGWDTTSGTGYFMNDVIGIDFPESPRILVSTQEIYPPSPGITVIEVNIASGMAYGIQVPSFLDLPSGISVTDLEAQRYL